MSTLAAELIREFDIRWKEVDLLIDIVDHLDDSDSKFQVICRATIVLIVANFEGYLKETLKCLIGDINSNHYFKNTSEKMKMTYCHQFFSPEEKNFEKKARRLIEVFDELDTKYSIEPFLFENNKNPKVKIIEKLFEEIGRNSFFGYVTNCDIEKAFENSLFTTTQIINRIKDGLIAGTEEFPYNIKIDEMGFNLKKTSAPKDCLWQTFLDRVLEARNAVAHGISQDNTMSLLEIKDTKEKIKVLELSFSALVFKYALKENVDIT